MGDEGIEQKNEVDTPILQYCVLCDNVTNPPGGKGKPVFSGVFSNVSRPSILPQFYVALRWTNGLGEHAATIKILDPHLNEIFKSPDISFKLSHHVSSTDHILQFSNFEFSKAGVYWIEILLNNETYSAFPLPVFEELKELD